MYSCFIYLESWRQIDKNMNVKQIWDRSLEPRIFKEHILISGKRHSQIRFNEWRSKFPVGPQTIMHNFFMAKVVREIIEPQYNLDVVRLWLQWATSKQLSLWTPVHGTVINFMFQIICLGEIGFLNSSTPVLVLLQLFSCSHQ